MRITNLCVGFADGNLLEVDGEIVSLDQLGSDARFDEDPLLCCDFCGGRYEEDEKGNCRRNLYSPQEGPGLATPFVFICLDCLPPEGKSVEMRRTRSGNWRAMKKRNNKFQRAKQIVVAVLGEHRMNARYLAARRARSWAELEAVAPKRMKEAIYRREVPGEVSR